MRLPRPGRAPSRPASRRLQLGSFTTVVPGWLNTDVTLHIAVSRLPGAARALRAAGRISASRYAEHEQGLFRRLYYLDATKPFPFADGTFDYVFTSHMLEHLHPADGAACVSEVHRVLRPGGLVRVVVPDLDYHVERYDPRRPDDLLASIYSYEGRSREPSHRWWYNEHSLGDLFGRSGFATWTRRAYREGRCPDLELLDSRPLSLFMEAEKAEGATRA